MTVKDLIFALKDFPQDLPVVTDYKEIDDVKYCDTFYFLEKHTKTGYVVEPAVVLE